ncbi:MAG: CopG family transcriptional regulator [Acidimicrobiales bacterium]
MESVRLDPELRELLAQRVQASGTTISDVIREALASACRQADPRPYDAASYIMLGARQPR